MYYKWEKTYSQSTFWYKPKYMKTQKELSNFGQKMVKELHFKNKSNLNWKRPVNEMITYMVTYTHRTQIIATGSYHYKSQYMCLVTKCQHSFVMFCCLASFPQTEAPGFGLSATPSHKGCHFLGPTFCIIACIINKINTTGPSFDIWSIFLVTSHKMDVALFVLGGFAKFAAHLTLCAAQDYCSLLRRLLLMSKMLWYLSCMTCAALSMPTDTDISL